MHSNDEYADAADAYYLDLAEGLDTQGFSHTLNCRCPECSAYELEPTEMTDAPAGCTLKGGVWIERRASPAAPSPEYKALVSLGAPFTPLRSEPHACYLPSSASLTVSSVPVAEVAPSCFDGKRLADASAAEWARWFFDRVRLAGNASRLGFHQPSCTQHVGLPVERTTSDYLQVMDNLMENATLASLRGSLERVGGRMRFVAAKTVGNESAWDTHEDFRVDESDPRESILWAGVMDSFDAHRAATIAAAVAQMGKPLSDWSKDDWKASGLGDRLRTLRRLAGAKRVLVNGGRERMQPHVGDFGPDGKPEPVEVHRNELPASSNEVITLGQGDSMRERWEGRTVRREAKDAMRQESIDAQRVAPDDDSYHAGSGISKGHTHMHLGFDDGALPAMRALEEMVLQADAVAELVKMRGELPHWPVWKRARVSVGFTWVCRNRLEDEVLLGEREDSTPCFYARGSRVGVWVSAADEGAYESIVW
jgi:hypothetical protein